MASLVVAATPVDYRGVPNSYSDLYAPYLPFDPDETLTVVERGRLVRGVLDKKAVGAKASGGLFHLVGREYGPQRAIDAIFALQQVALQFLLRRGFSVGTADLVPTAAARDAFAILRSSVTLRGPDTFARSASTAKGTARQNEGCTRKPRDAEKRRARTSLSGSSRSTCMH